MSKSAENLPCGSAPSTDFSSRDYLTPLEFMLAADSDQGLRAQLVLHQLHRRTVVLQEDIDMGVNAPRNLMVLAKLYRQMGT
jgi:hypothetical protein